MYSVSLIHEQNVSNWNMNIIRYGTINKVEQCVFIISFEHFNTLTL